MGRISSGVLGLAVLAGCADAPSGPVDSVVLVTVDTWRADRLGAGGHPDLRTPHLDRFFRGATQYAEAHAPVPTTLASHTSMLSGEWPSGHGVARNGWPVPEEVTTVAEIAHAAGVATAAFVSSAALDPSFRLDQGFDVYDAEVPSVVERDQDWRPAGDTLARAGAWWRATSGRRFLWVHLFEPHFPYSPEPHDLALYATGYDGPADGSMDFLFALWADPELGPPPALAHLEALYHAEITGVDRALGRFLAEVAGAPSTLAIVTSDHGESLGEHGLLFKHGPHVYPGDVQVPLALRGAAPFGPAVIDRPVRTIDLAPTMLGALGIVADLPPDAVDLAHPGGEPLPVFAEASMPWNVEVEGVWANAHKQRVIRTGDWSLVVTPWQDRRQWFDRRLDPAELHEVPPPPDLDLAERLDEWSARRAVRTAPLTVDPDLIRRLESLGYIDR